MKLSISLLDLTNPHEPCLWGQYRLGGEEEGDGA
jgi:hypothetical protein